MNDINPIESLTGSRKFKPYPLYRESGIQCLGTIPEHWEIRKVTWNFDIGSGTTPPSDDAAYYDGDVPWVTTSELRESVIVSTEKTVNSNAMRKLPSLRLHPEGSVVVAMYGATIGRLGILGVAATVNQACCVFSKAKLTHPRFWFYWLQMRRPYLISLGYGGGQPNLSQELLRSIRFPVPPLAEQLAIAAFLDRETAKIDALVAKKERLIELLQEKRAALITRTVTKGLDPNVPMKDSGVEWLGEIPAHWQPIPLQAACDIRGRIGYRGYSVADIVPPGEGAITLSPSNIVDDGLDVSECTYLSWYKYRESPEIQIALNDIILTKTGSTLGKVALITRCDEAMTINPQLVILRCREGSNPAFMAYVLRCDGIKDLYWLENSGGATPTISQQKVGQFKVPFPGSVEEQGRIAAFLSGEISGIEALVAKVRNAIDHLRELRTTLISAAVTGKIDVREEAA